MSKIVQLPAKQFRLDPRLKNRESATPVVSRSHLEERKETEFSDTATEQRLDARGWNSADISNVALRHAESVASSGFDEFQQAEALQVMEREHRADFTIAASDFQLSTGFQHAYSESLTIEPRFEQISVLRHSGFSGFDQSNWNLNFNGLWSGLALAGFTSGASRATSDSAFIQGQIVAGPVLAGNSLMVKVYDVQGHLLTTGQVDSSGRYKLALGQYIGPVVMLVVDSDKTKPDYVDEVTKKPINLNGNLMATAIVSADMVDQTFNINPITTAAAIKAGIQLSADGSAVKAALSPTLQGQSLQNAVQDLQSKILNAGAAVAKALGLGSNLADLVQAPIVPTVNVDGSTNSNANSYGKLLAAVAGMDVANVGNSSLTLSILTQGITDAGALTSNAQIALSHGAQLAGVSSNFVAAQSVFMPQFQSTQVSVDQPPKVLEFTVNKSLLIPGDTAKIKLVFDEPVYNLTSSDLTAPLGTITQWTRSVDRKTWTGVLKVPGMSFAGSNQLVLTGAYQDSGGNNGPINIKSTTYTIDNVILDGSSAIQLTGPSGQSNTGTTLDNVILDGSSAIQLTGPSGQSNTGTSLSFIGDLNGDGKQELAVGAPMWQAETTGYSAGAIFVVAGTSSRENLTLAFNAPKLLYPSDSAASESGFGWQVSGVGDVDADGLPDVAISAPYFNGLNGYESGLVYLVRGNKNGTLTLPLNDKDPSGWKVTGSAESSALGWAVSSAGDFNGDGYKDVLLGAPFAGSEGSSDTGQIVLVLGGLQGQDLKKLTVLGQSAGDWLGYAVAGGGDVNGDGLSDVVVSAPDADVTVAASTSVDAGVVYVLYGNKEDKFSLSDAVAGNNGRVISGFDDGQSAGHSVAMIGDVNGDGYSDILIGAPDHLSSQGAAWLVWGGRDNSPLDLSNPESRAIKLYDNTQPMGQLGALVAAAGDFNCDGFADFVLTAPGANSGTGIDSGISYLIFGRASSAWNPTFDVSHYAFRAVLNGTASGDAAYGITVAGKGDLNGDNLPDLVIGYPNALSGQGEFKIFMGSDSYITVPHISGTTMDDTINSTSKAEVLLGGYGNDSITASLGDFVLAGSGDDTIIIDPSWHTGTIINPSNPSGSINGGYGVDTLKISDVLQWDWASNPSINANIKSVEILDMTDAAQQTIRISKNNILNFTEANLFNSSNGWTGLPITVNSHQFVVRGNANDILYIDEPDSSWVLSTASFNQISYQVYTNSIAAAQLLVSTEMQVIWNASPLQ